MSTRPTRETTSTISRSGSKRRRCRFSRRVFDNRYPQMRVVFFPHPGTFRRNVALVLLFHETQAPEKQAPRQKLRGASGRTVLEADIQTWQRGGSELVIREPPECPVPYRLLIRFI